ncbi:MAG TPA: TIGR04295 family B12-binding domain-containing radical SAM protein [Bryobacteraceae bacterium]|jgi:anaerobic magnesium-protoporphyrin IX monomethyl ester cyclase|nr:TIGR04295 family B12-binding domain-containing radical SAM protein [Bryobacteraceae bacterium]
MRYALVNPAWTFDGSIYFGCREPHLPLEFGYSKALLEAQGHEVLMIDGQMAQLTNLEIRETLHTFHPDFTVVTTTPSYLFWRCAPPEVTVPKRLVREIHDVAENIVIVGPHGSTTPVAVLAKLQADVVVMGECEETLPKLARSWSEIDAITYFDRGRIRKGAGHASDMSALPALEWPEAVIHAHSHHHHRFDTPFFGFGAEMEASRGCPYHCTFCAKDNFRNRYRKRPLSIILAELDRVIAQGVTYVYFIDEIFLPDGALLEALASRDVKIGIQTRIDLWNHRMIDLLARAGCVSIEAGIESLTSQGRNLLEKRCKLETDELSERLIYAKKQIAFVQANLIKTPMDDDRTIAEWREQMRRAGVWANDPVPMFPYPGSPDYTLRWGLPDDRAWERAHEYYLAQYAQFSEIQESRPLPLSELEHTG